MASKSSSERSAWLLSFLVYTMADIGSSTATVGEAYSVVLTEEAGGRSFSASCARSHLDATAKACSRVDAPCS